MACYLSCKFSTFVKVIQENVHQLILRIIVVHWNWQSLWILESIDINTFWFPSFMCNVLKNISYLLLLAKVMFTQCNWSFEMNFTPSTGNSAINLLLWTSIFACRRLIISFLHNIIYPPLLFFYHLGVLHKFPCTVKISFPVIL